MKHRRDVVRGACGPEVLEPVASTREIPSEPSTYARARSQASPPTYDATSRRRHDSEDAQSTAYRQPIRAMATAGTVPTPTLGSQVALQRREGAVRSGAGVHVPAGQRRQHDGQHHQDHGDAEADPRCGRGRPNARRSEDGRHLADARCRNRVSRLGGATDVSAS